MSNIRYQTKIVRVSETPRILRRTLVRSWVGAAGSLRGHKHAIEKHIQTVRKEWRGSSRA